MNIDEQCKDAVSCRCRREENAETHAVNSIDGRVCEYFEAFDIEFAFLSDSSQPVTGICRQSPAKQKNVMSRVHSHQQCRDADRSLDVGEPADFVIV